MEISFNLAALMDEYNLNLEEGQARLNQSRVAEGTGLAATTVFRIYNNRTDRVSLKTLERLCEFFNCPPSDLLKKQ